MDTATTPTIFIIVGITGDLAKRKLLPAVEAIAKTGLLRDDFQILGITRRADVDKESLLKDMKESAYVRDHLTLFTMDVNNPDDYPLLTKQLEKIERNFSAPAQRLFYLSIPPEASQPVITMLGSSGLANTPETKLLLEKPFGTDLASATELVTHIDAYFAPEQVYRIDHYLAKEMAQNLIVFRENNALFRRTWNNEFIERIEIVASETIGIEGRGNFYEQTGALRDLIQSHLLQLAALAYMDTEDTTPIPLRRLAALKGLRVPSSRNVQTYAKRGQYHGYAEEAGNPGSAVETFVSLELESDSAHFSGIPLRLVTGKMLDTKTTEIRIFYKKDQVAEAEELILRLQPNEGISIGIWSKRPGYEEDIEKKMLNFTYAENSDVLLAEAYEKVLIDTMRSHHDLFISSEEVLESWRIIAPVQEAWKNSIDDLFTYESGSNPDELVK